MLAGVRRRREVRHTVVVMVRSVLLVSSSLLLACGPKAPATTTAPGTEPPVVAAESAEAAVEPVSEPGSEPSPEPDAAAAEPAAEPEPASEPEPNPNRLAFERPLTLDLTAPPAPTDGSRFVPLTDKLPLRPIAKEHRVRGGMHRLGRDPIRGFRQPLPEGFGPKRRLRAIGWWFPTPDTPILVIPHFRSNRGQSVEAALLATPGAEGFVTALVGGEKTDSNYDCASTLVMSEDQSEIGWYREMSYTDMDSGEVEEIEFLTCRVRGISGGVEAVCEERDAQGRVRSVAPPGR